LNSVDRDMKSTHLEGLDAKLSCLGLGGEQLGGHGWGKVSESQLVKAVHKAIDSGVTLFDTAPIYGLGHSEELLGKALGAHRRNVILATKVGFTWKKNDAFKGFIDNSPANINQEIDTSLKRLRTDYIDFYQIHWPDPNTPIEDTLFAMKKLKQSGKIRCIGCCNFPLDLLKEAIKYAEINTLQIPYNLVDRKFEGDLLPFCGENNIAVLAYSPIARGLLSGKYDKNVVFNSDDRRSRSEDEYFQGEALMKNLEILKRLKFVAKKLGKTPPQIAVRWVLENAYITTAIFGAKSSAQVEENTAASDFTLSQEDMEFLNKDM